MSAYLIPPPTHTHTLYAHGESFVWSRWGTGSLGWRTHDLLTMVVSAMDPKLLIKMLQVTFTGGPAETTESRGQRWDRGTDGLDGAEEKNAGTGRTCGPAPSRSHQHHRPPHQHWSWTGLGLFTETSKALSEEQHGLMTRLHLVPLWSWSDFLSWFCRCESSPDLSFVLLRFSVLLQVNSGWVHYSVMSAGWRRGSFFIHDGQRMSGSSPIFLFPAVFHPVWTCLGQQRLHLSSWWNFLLGSNQTRWGTPFSSMIF